MASTAPTETPAGSDTDTLSLLDLVQERLSQGVLVVTAQGRILDFTAAVPTLLDVPAASLREETVESLPAPVRELIRRTLAEGVSLPQNQIDLPRDGGAPRRREVTILPVRHRDETLAVVLLSDGSTVGRILRRIEQVDRLASVGTLSANMCHEIKNAMVAVKTFVDLLLKHNQDAELAGLVSREMRRIDSLVSQMLRFAGPARPVMTAFHLHENLDHTLKLIERQAAERRVVLTRQFEAGADKVRGDQYQIQQAFLNLFLNALEAMPSGGTLTVSTAVTSAAGAGAAPVPERLSVKVQDTGPGVAPENLPRLFEAFFTTKPAGNGLGLAITQRILREHGGTIAVDSAPGHGATFTVTLPRAAASH